MRQLNLALELTPLCEVLLAMHRDEQSTTKQHFKMFVVSSHKISRGKTNK